MTIFISHRIIGPIFKIGKHLKKISEGQLNLSALRLRDGDEGQILCDMMNEVQDNFRQRFLKLKNLEQSLNETDSKEKQQIASEIAKALDGIQLDTKNRK